MWLHNESLLALSPMFPWYAPNDSQIKPLYKIKIIKNTHTLTHTQTNKQTLNSGPIMGHFWIVTMFCITV